jgi:hypothetical protein
MSGSIDAYRCLEASMTGKLREFIFLTLASLLFWVIRVPEIGGKSVLEGKSTIF